MSPLVVGAMAHSNAVAQIRHLSSLSNFASLLFLLCGYLLSMYLSSVLDIPYSKAMQLVSTSRIDPDRQLRRLE